MPLQTPATTEKFEKRKAAPRDAQKQAKTLMTELGVKRGIDVSQCWEPEINAWILPVGPTPLIVRLNRVESDAEDGKKKEVEDYLIVTSRVMRLPTHGLLALYRFVLETNMNLTSTAFAVCEEHLYLTSQRPLQDLDESELDAAIGHTVSAVTYFRSLLLEEFAVGAVPL